MPSEHRLHPSSIIFNIGKHFGALAVPLILLFIGMGSDEDRYEVYAIVFTVPYAAVTISRYLSFRYRYDDNELVIRHGFIFRNQRHVPYDRIQNIDAVQNVLHRALGVVEVRLQTGAGSEPEATLSVLTIDAVDEMRRRVFGGKSLRRTAPAGESLAEVPVVEAAEPEPLPSRTLLQLSPRDLTLYGIIENRGLFVIAAAIGLLWEFAAMPRLVERFFGEEAGRGLFRWIGRTFFAGGGPTPAAILLGLSAILLFLLISRVFSIAWALIQLHGFTIVQTGDDLRTEYGLLTRVVQTIPRRRIQAVTIRQTPLHRWLKRASVRVSTAGGGAEQGRDTSRKEWFAPVMRVEEVPALIAVLMPGVDVRALDWQPVHPGAFIRAVRRAHIGVAIYQAIALAVFGARAWWLLPLFSAWAIIRARWYVSYLGWARTRDAVASRTGAIVQAVTIAPLVRIQAVDVQETPFDRRTGMAHLHVDTAGAGTSGYGVDVPYLPREVADRLHAELGAAAATTAFQW